MTKAEIGPADDVLLKAVLVKLFDDRQLQITEPVLNYLCTRIERSFASAHYWVAKIDETALAQKKAITIPLIRQLMS